MLAMVDTFNNLVANEPSIPTVAYPATNADVQSVLHNNRSIFALLVFFGLTMGRTTFYALIDGIWDPQVMAWNND